MVATLVVYLNLFQIVFGSFCFKAGQVYINPGLNDIETRVLDGAAGSGICLVAVKGPMLPYFLAKYSCAEMFPSGQLMTIVHYDAFIDGWRRAADFWKLDFYGYVDFPLTIPDGCWIVRVSSTIEEHKEGPLVDCTFNNIHYICQYPFQYNCAFEKRASETLVKIGGKVYFNVTTVWWQSSDYAPLDTNCSQESSTLQETSALLANCTDPKFGDWMPWSDCSGTCADNGTVSSSPTQYRRRKILPRCLSLVEKLIFLYENRTCNTHIPCFVTSTSSITTVTSAKPSVGKQVTLYGGIACAVLAGISFVLAIAFFIKNK